MCKSLDGLSSIGKGVWNEWFICGDIARVPQEQGLAA